MVPGVESSVSLTTKGLDWTAHTCSGRHSQYPCELLASWGSRSCIAQLLTEVLTVPPTAGVGSPTWTFSGQWDTASAPQYKVPKYLSSTLQLNSLAQSNGCSADVCSRNSCNSVESVIGDPLAPNVVSKLQITASFPRDVQRSFFEGYIPHLLGSGRYSWPLSSN